MSFAQREQYMTKTETDQETMATWDWYVWGAVGMEGQSWELTRLPAYLSRINGKTWKTRLMGNALDWMSRERGSAETGWNTSPAHEGVWGWGMGMPQCKLETPETLCGCRRTKERSMQGIRVSVDKCEICSCAEHLELLWDMCFRS